MSAKHPLMFTTESRGQFPEPSMFPTDQVVDLSYKGRLRIPVGTELFHLAHLHGSRTEFGILASVLTFRMNETPVYGVPLTDPILCPELS